MNRYDHAERVLRGRSLQSKLELYAVLLRDLRRSGATEHDLQREADTLRCAELMQSCGASGRQIETTLKESDEMNTPEQAPKCPADCPFCTCRPAKRVARLKQELAEAEAALAAERMAVADKIDAKRALVSATLTLLSDIRVLVVAKNPTYQRKEFMKYRAELAPIAAAYGVEIVPVGDGTEATLVLNWASEGTNHV